MRVGFWGFLSIDEAECHQARAIGEHHQLRRREIGNVRAEWDAGFATVEAVRFQPLENRHVRKLCEDFAGDPSLVKLRGSDSELRGQEGHVAAAIFKVTCEFFNTQVRRRKPTQAISEMIVGTRAGCLRTGDARRVGTDLGLTPPVGKLDDAAHFQMLLPPSTT